MHFELQATCPETGARAGLLHTAHGVVETPVFMPVGTQATIKGVLPKTVETELNAGIILANTYHLFLRPGHELIRKLGGLHKFMAWPRAILTDSGGFQVFSLNALTKITDEGVLFKSHLNGDPHMFTPESTLDIQLALGSDICMVLDECLPYPSEHKATEKSMGRTIRWAKQAYTHFEKMHPEQTQACFPIVQGSMYKDLRQACAQELMEIPAKGFAIGEYVAQGIDMMDCVLPSRSARHGLLFTNQGKLKIKRAEYREDPRPVDETCPCYTCRTFTRAYLRHLFLAEELIFHTLATIHNLQHYLDIMRSIRHAIILGVFPERLREIRSSLSGSIE